jgi:hypothetical protein
MDDPQGTNGEHGRAEVCEARVPDLALLSMVPYP